MVGPSRLAVVVLLAVLACAACGSAVAGAAGAGKRVLVLLQDDSLKTSHSKYFGALEKAGFTLDFKAYKDASLKLREYDTWLYDHLAIFAPKAEGFGGAIDVPGILDFVDSGRNLILAASSDVSDALRSLAAEVGVDVDEKGTAVYDHFHHAAGGDHTLVIAKDIVDSKGIFGGAVKAPVLFRGVAATVPADSELVTVALSAPVTAYSHDPRKSLAEPPQLMAGAGISLLALVQARNNARVLVTGSLDLLSNDLWGVEVVEAATGKKLGPSGNEAVAVGASLWALQARGVLQVEYVRHRVLSSPPDAPLPSSYRVNDEVEFAVDLWEVTNGKRTPYQADDVQVEFVMLDPYVRLPLARAPATPGSATYKVQFKVPDVYGVFKYVVQYAHTGYSRVDITQQVPVRPFKHNEYERFLTCAWPYYASAMSSMFAFLALGFFFLYHK